MGRGRFAVTKKMKSVVINPTDAVMMSTISSIYISDLHIKFVSLLGGIFDCTLGYMIDVHFI